MREIPRATSKVTSAKSPLAPDETACRKKTNPSLNGRIKTTPPPLIVSGSAKNAANQPFAISKDGGGVVAVSARESMISDISSSRPNSTASEGEGDFSDMEEEDEEEEGDDDETTTEYSESCRDDDDGPSSEEEEEREQDVARPAAALDPISEENSLANKTSDDGY